MKWLNLKPEGRFMKAARVDGEVLGKLSPHGSSYSSIVTLAAPWSNNLPYVTGHGNFGDSACQAASSRYTECKLSPFAWDVLLDNSDTWQTIDNYDGSLQEPVELNVKIPAVFLNGQEGIGVGLTTKIPQHNLRDICDAVVKDTDLYPDFSTGCLIVRDQGLEDYVQTGAGSIRCRAVLEVGKLEKSGRKAERAKLIFTNLPLSTNPEKIGEQIKDALEKNKFDGVAEVVDESDMTGDRVAVIAKPGVDSSKLSQLLYHYTDLDTKFSARTLVIDGTKPVELNAKDLITKWKTWRLDRLRVQFEHEQDAKKARLEIVEGLSNAIGNIDKIIALIRASQSKSEALIKLLEKPHKFSRNQANAILEMRLHQLTKLDADALATEKSELLATIAKLTELISNEKARSKYMVAEIKAIGTRYGETRRSELIDPPESLTVEKGSSRSATPLAKPRFLKIDMKRGVIEQTKGPRGALILETSDKLVCLTDDGMLRKLPATFKGTLSNSCVNVALAAKERDVAERKYLCVFMLNENLQALSISGEDLCRTTSTGKRFIPETATLVHFGEGPYKVLWVSTRKKTIELSPLTVKMGKPGAKGIKVAHMEEVTL